MMRKWNWVYSSYSSSQSFHSDKQLFVFPEAQVSLRKKTKGVNPLLGNIFHRQKEMLYGSFVFPYLSLSLSWRIKRESLLYPIPVLGSNMPKVILHSWVILTPTSPKRSGIPWCYFGFCLSYSMTLPLSLSNETSPWTWEAGPYFTNLTSLREKILAPGWGLMDTRGFLDAAQNLAKYLVLKPNAGFEP